MVEVVGQHVFPICENALQWLRALPFIPATVSSYMKVEPTDIPIFLTCLKYFRTEMNNYSQWLNISHHYFSLRTYTMYTTATFLANI